MSMLLDLTRFRGARHPEVEVKKDAQKVRLVGRLTTTLGLNCGRCLEPYTIPIDTALDLLFLPVAEQVRATDLEMSDADVGVSYYKDDQIDLGEIVREQFYLALPMKPVCRDDCAGLCPICGINRNRDECDCQATWVDPRLEPLRRLKSQ